MIKQIAIPVLAVVLIGADCGTDPPSKVETNPAHKLIGVYAYFRTSGNMEAQWIVSCDLRDNAQGVGCGTFWGTVWVDDNQVWRLNVDTPVEIPYELSGNAITFWFDDGIEPRRSSQLGNLVVESDRVVRMEGSDWYARKCYTSCFGT